MKEILLTSFVVFFFISMFAFVSILPDHQIGEEEYQQYAVLFPPWKKTTDVFNSLGRAGGVPVRITSLEFIIISASKDIRHGRKLYREGALLVFNPIVKGACLIQRQNKF